MRKKETNTANRSSKGIGILFLVIFIDLMGFSIIFPLFPAILEHYLPEGAEQAGLLGSLVASLESLTQGAGDQAKFMVSVLFGGLLGSLYSALQFVFSPIWGRLSDRRGRRGVLLLTLAGTCLSYVAWIFAGSFAILLVARFLAGVMSGNIAVASAAVSDITTKENRSKGMAVIGIAFGLGFLLGPAIGGISAQLNLLSINPELAKWGINPFSVPALVAFLLSGVNWLWAWKRLPETLPVEKRAKEASASESRLLAIFLVDSPAVRNVCWIYLIFIASFSGMEFTLTFLAVERFAYTPLENGLMFLFIGFCLIITQGGIVRRFAPKVGEKPLAIGGIVSGGIAFGILAIFSSQTSFYIALGFLALAGGLTTPTLSALVSLYVSEQEQGRYLGIFRSAGAFARVVGPLTAASLYFFMGPQVSYALGAALLVLPFLSAIKLKTPCKEESIPAEEVTVEA